MIKKEMAKRLINDDLETISQYAIGNPDEYWGGYLFNILSNGFKGYNQMTNTELKFEYHNRFEPD